MANVSHVIDMSMDIGVTPFSKLIVILNNNILGVTIV